MAPITTPNNSKNPVRQQLQSIIDTHKVAIFSKSYCPYCNDVKDLFDSIGVEYFSMELDREEEGETLQNELTDMSGQRTVPNVYVNGTHVGGCDATKKLHGEGRLQPLLDKPKYDYDLIVIGGGSGGLAASKEARLRGAKVAVFDFVKPTPTDTTWGLGGTCVNVGCIPKKLMHQASILGHSVHDAKKFGWEVAEDAAHNWETMKEGIQAHIGSLNWGYRVQLRTKGVDYFNAYAEFVAPHTIKATDKKKKEVTVTADKFIVATGLRPKYPDIPGDREFGITSDDLFSLPYNPGKTCIVGASYVALECAGFLRGIGLEVVVLVRSILLRGFDQDMSERIGTNMEEQGIRMVRECLPTKVELIEKGQPNRIMVTAQMKDGSTFEEEFNTILFAIGREARTAEINAGAVGLLLNEKNGKIIAENECSNVDYIYGIGDILDGKPELTPVAIQAGKLLARRLFAGSTVQCDYLNIPTTVFTPLEYGSCGYSEEEAIGKFGDDNIEVYHANFWPLEYTVPKRSENDCYVKLVCLIPEKEKVIGFHYLGPNAGEVTQGFGLGIRMGATKEDFEALIGIHPTCAEIFTTLTATKRSGVDVKASGC